MNFAYIAILSAIFVAQYVDAGTKLPLPRPRLVPVDTRGLADDIQAQLETLQQWMQEGNEELGIPVLDPFNLDHWEYGKSNEDITFNVAFDGVTVTGLSDFEMTFIDVDLLHLHVDTTFNLPQIRAKADHYYLDGILAGILPLFGEGAVDVAVNNINVSVGVSLRSAPETGLVSLTNVSLDVHFESIEGTIENILGGDLDDVINDILNLLGPEIFDSAEGLIGEDVSAAIMEFANEQLEGMTLQDLIDGISGGGGKKQIPAPVAPKAGNANDYLDAILENVRAYLIENGFDNYALPDQVEGFTDEWLGIEWHGEAQLTEGFLTGLETIHRSGDAELSVDGETGTISLSSTIEFFDLNGGYKMYVGFMDIGIDATAAVTISSLKIFLRARLIVTQDPFKAFEVVIDELNILNPGLVTVVFDGLGVLDFLLDGLGFIVGNIFGGLILDAVEGPITEAITAALGEVLPFRYLY